MKLLVINPNTTATMTDAVVTQVREQVSDPGVQVSGATARFGCPVIASRASFAIAAHSALDLLALHRHQADGVLLACFGDPGLEALAEISPVPVVGLAQASIERAITATHRFAIITTGQAWVPMLRERVAIAQALPALVDIVALGVDGRDLAAAPNRFAQEIVDRIGRLADDGASAVILGGAAFAGLTPVIAAMLRTQPRTATVTLIDGIEAATTAALRAMASPMSPVDAEVGAGVRMSCEGLSPELSRVLAQG